MDGAALVTREPNPVGTELGSGDILTTVNERPVFVFTGKTPAYRDLVPGARGEDVAQLQDALVQLGYPIGDNPGEYAEDTAYAVYRFYQNSGYYPPGDTDKSEDEKAAYQTGFPKTEYYFIDKESLVVESKCGEKGRAPAEPLCLVSDGIYEEYFVLDNSNASKKVASGQEAKVLLNNGEELNVKVGARGSGENNSIIFTLEIPDVEGKDFSNARVLVTTASSAVNALTVPEAALYSYSDGSYYVVYEGEEIKVSLGFCSAGYCEISSQSQAIQAGISLSLKEEN